MDFDCATIKRNTLVLHVCYYICKQNLNLTIPPRKRPRLIWLLVLNRHIN